MDLKNLWVAEYSASQRCFHVATLESALVANTSMVIGKNNNDYLMFWVGETCEEANAACDAMAELHKGGVTPQHVEAIKSTSSRVKGKPAVAAGIEAPGPAKAATESSAGRKGL